MGVFLPDVDPSAAVLKQNQTWQFIYAAPIFLYALMAVGFSLIVQTDGPLYCLQKRHFEKCKVAIANIYQTQSEAEVREIMVKLESEANRGSSVKPPTLMEAFVTDPRYVRCQWVNVWNMIFHELAGINVVYIYSNTLLARVLTADNSFITPRTGTYVISIVNLLAYMQAIWTVQQFGRRPLLGWGYAGIAVSHLAIGWSILYGFDEGIIVMLCLFIWLYANTTGPLAWVYSAETCSEIGLGVCLLTLWAVVLAEVLAVPTLMNTGVGADGVFFIFGILSAIGAFFVWRFLRETQGLTDKEKRSLYAPSSKASQAEKLGLVSPGGYYLTDQSSVLNTSQESIEF